MIRPGLLKLRGFFLPGFLLAAALFSVCQPALAEKRVALVLGNSTYQNAPPLTNPIKDGTVMAATFKSEGFALVASPALLIGSTKTAPTSPNTLIAYAAKPASTAQDGDGKNSPFTTALAQHLTTPGLDVRKAFGFVRDDVLKSTGNRQEPFVYGSLGGNDVPLVPPRAVPAQPAVNPQSEIRRDYELALQVGNKAAMSAFIAQHPDGFY